MNNKLEQVLQQRAWPERGRREGSERERREMATKKLNEMQLKTTKCAMNAKLATTRRATATKGTAKRETNRCGKAKSKRNRNLQAAVRWFDGSMGSAGNTRRSD